MGYTLKELGVGEIGDKVGCPTYDRNGMINGFRIATVAGDFPPYDFCVYPLDETGFNQTIQIANPGGPPQFRNSRVFIEVLDATDEVVIITPKLTIHPPGFNERWVQIFSRNRPDFEPLNQYQRVRSFVMSLGRRLKQPLYALKYEARRHNLI